MNKTNLELKHYCNDFAKIRAILKEIGAKKIVVKNQKDYFFNLPSIKKTKSPRLKLRIENKKQYLIYYERPKFVRGKDTASAVELYDVRDGQLLPFLIKSLGTKAIVEKKREIWRKNNTVFHLDTVKDVGNIFEIELQKEGGEITETDKKIFRSYQNKLLPYLGSVIKGSNADLVKKR